MDKDTPQPPLFDAAQEDDVDRVKELLSSKTDVAMTSGPFSWTALHVAAGYGAASVTEFLLNAGVSVNVRSSDGETPLHIAAQQGCEVGIRQLASNSAEIDATNDDGETPLHTAVQHIGGKDVAGITALLELRANPMIKDSSGLDACGHAHVNTNRAEELVAILNPNGAKMDSSLDEELAGVDQACALACSRGQVELVEQLLLVTPDSEALAERMLIPTAKGGHIEVAEFLLVAKADLHKAVDKRSGHTPLSAAADENAIKMVKWLLEQKVDANYVSADDGATALMAASLRGSDEAATALLAGNADVNFHNSAGWTALMLACQSGRTSVTKLLLDAGAQMDFVSSTVKKTAKDLAADNNHTGVVKLLETRAKLNSRRAKATQAKENDNDATEDTRDMEALLADLGETPASASSSKAKKKKPSKASASKTNASQEADEARAAADTEKMRAAKQKKDDADKLNTEAAAKKVAADQKASKQPAEAKQQAAVDSRDTKSLDVGSVAAPPIQEDRCLALRARLKEIDKIRTALVEEELSIRKELSQLEGS